MFTFYICGANQGQKCTSNGLEKSPFLFEAPFLSLVVTRFLSAIPWLALVFFFSLLSP